MNKVVIPAILSVTILIAGIFAFMPVEKAATVHTTILADTAEEVRDQDRYLFWEIDATAAITNMILIHDIGGDISGNMTATLVDEGASGSSVVNCQDTAGDDLTIAGGFNSIDTVGLMVTSVLPADCESIKADVANGDHVIIALTIDITEEG